ncbi:NFX1-type zinc finger-containing protein 1-like isoform X4 [Periplaneta americana]|uniref:NFX1-type zinc finger-containing protein 1-like isoform X4 n=1 Tax=Periplaneta americana TaxID=6978 RepID=UPI0037E9748F
MDKHKASKERRSQYHHKSSVWSRLGDKKAGTQSKYHQKSVWTRLGDTKRVELTSTASTSSSSSSSRNYSTGNYQNRKRTHSNDTSNERHSHYLSKRKRTHENNFSPESYNSKPQFGYKRLEGLTKISSNEVVTILANRDTGFKELLIDKLRPDFIHLIVRTLAKVSEADFNENKTFILTMACQQDFLNQLLQHIISISIEGRKSDFEDFLSALLKFLKTVLELLPNYASDRFQKILRSTDMTINGMTTYHNVSVSTNLKEEFNCLQVQLNNLMEDKEKQANSRNESKPPDDFRKISVYPTPDEILTKKLPFLRPNKTKGAYSDVENYLDIQFRLLREDFVCPLREGIMNYLHSKPTKKNNRVHNVRIYKNVTFKSMKVTSNKIGVLVNFDPNFKNKKISWINSKRFMFGSLLCFTDDDFRSIILATVIDRDIKLLKSGLVLVELCAGTHISESLFNHSYTMAESEVYFEPYFHVLKGLQAMTEDKFPLKKYIVDVDCTDSTPQYLLVQKNVKYKLSHEPSYSPSSPTYTPTSPTYTPASPSHSPSLPSCSTYSTSSTVAQSSNSVDKSEVPNMRDAKIKSNALEDVASTPKLTPVLNFTVLDFDSWPSAEQLSLDGSQYNAFRSALTREFVVIQGPPGTGKTHLGLKMTEVLLNNSSVWKSTDRPILVVCYTNHALDQFLEGLLCTTEELVRVGGQSKSEYLRKFNLNQKRHLEVRKFACTQLSLSIKREMENYVRCLKEIELDLEILNKYSGIVSLHSLKSIMRREHYDFFISLSESVEKVDEAFIGWLMENDLDFSTENEKSTFEFDSTEKLENMEVDLELHDDERKSLETLFSDIDVDFTEVNARLQMSVTIENLEKWLAVICEMQKQKQEDASVFYMLEMESNTVRKTLKCLKYHLQRLKSRLRMSFAYLKSEENLLSLRIEQRWNLYSYWLQLLQKSLLNETENINKKFHKEAKRYEEVKHKEDLVILKKALVVGMTTSGAARLQPLLQALRPPIVIVEEAAEVLEAHIITALTKHCQHLILIGDHKQLKPSTAVYKLSRKFNLDTSLFERMVSNGMHCETLKVQHRMRPEIARLIVPSIYPDLRNHNSVLSFPKIRGVVKNLFFVTHDIPEEECPNISSRKNVHEAHFLLALCRHLIFQGYDPCRITILTTYKGQMFAMKNMLVEDSTLRDVRVTVVDNFQGEENDIILLSLVRSNDEGKIGFLTTENRVCVALSRARHGLFLIGNMENLKNASAVWKNIEETLSQQDAIGTHLKLQCEIHPDQQTLVSCAEDFSKVPEGGCTVQCMASLRCGHTCKSLCHINDRDHTVHRCYEPCKLTCELKHPCKLQCWQECGICKEPVLRNLPCGHEKELQCYIEYQAYECQVPVLRKLPCDHEKELECYVEYQTHICQVPVLRKLPCGHEMELECFVQYQMHKCQVKVLKKLSACGHEVTAECWMKEENIRCSFPCEIRLDCGHACTRRCHPFRDPDHEKVKMLNDCKGTVMFHVIQCLNVGISVLARVTDAIKDVYIWSVLCHVVSHLFVVTDVKLPVLNAVLPVCRNAITDVYILDVEESAANLVYHAGFVLLEDCGHSIEAKGLEEWLNIHDDQKDIQIETKVCPLCKTPINRTQRFMNVVKAQYNDVLTIKRRVFGDVAAIRRKEEALVRKLNSRSFYTGPEEISDLYVKMLRILNDALYAQRSKTFLNYCEVEKLEIQTDVLCEIDEAIQKLGIRGVFLSCETKNKVDKRIHFLLWICKRREIERGDLYTSEQEVADLNLELQRFKRIIQLFALENTANFENMRTENVTNLQQKVTQLAFSMKRYSKDTDKILESDLKALKEALKSTLNITETERKLIVKAIGLKQGHWYKCPNGHIYVITECGGAMQEAKCNECKAKIGGTNHRLLFSNRLAQEMDGATHSAWSEAANMRNYHW